MSAGQQHHNIYRVQTNICDCSKAVNDKQPACQGSAEFDCCYWFAVLAACCSNMNLRTKPAAAAKV